MAQVALAALVPEALAAVALADRAAAAAALAAAKLAVREGFMAAAAGAERYA